MSNFLICCSLKSNYTTTEYKRKYLPQNVIYQKDRSAIFFWDNNQTKIEKIKIPIDTSSSQIFQKMFEGSSNIIMMKSMVKDNTEYLYKII